MKILHLIASPRGNASYSIKLGNAVIEKLQATSPDSTVNIRNLATSPFPHLEEVHLHSFYTPTEQRTPELVNAVRHSDEAIAELMEADVIVIDAPMYNFNIPSTLKSWIDHISRAGVTFRYTAEGPEGLVKGKKVYVAISSGGIYSEGPLKDFDFIEPYLRFYLSFIGITDVTVYRVEGLQIPDLKDHAFDLALEKVAL